VQLQFDEPPMCSNIVARRQRKAFNSLLFSQQLGGG
jgi:hypothetical protein